MTARRAASVHDDCDRLLTTCRTLLTRDDWAMSHWWARGAAHLARQAIESCLDDFWAAYAPPLAGASQRARFLGLHAYVDDWALVRSGHTTWSQLSRACHHHAYELAPTVDELHGWVDAAQRFCDDVRAAARSASAAT